MSTSGISSSLSQLSQLETLIKNDKQFLTDFQTLGTDLQSGNLSAAQQDFVTLSKDAQTSAAASPAAFANTNQTGQSALDADMKTLSQDLKSGDLAGAQQAFSQVTTDMQSAGQSTGSTQKHHHHDADSDSSSSSSSSSSILSQLLQALFGTSSSSTAASSSTASSGTTSTSSDSGSSTSAVTGTSSTASSVAATTGTSGTASTAGSTDLMAKLKQDFQAVGSALQSGDLAGAQKAFVQFAKDAQSIMSAGATHHHSHTEGADSSGTEQLLQAFMNSQSASSSTTSSSTATSASNSSVNVNA